MNDETPAIQTGSAVKVYPAWLVGIAGGLIVTAGPPLCHAVFPRGVFNIPENLWNILLGYYWALLLRHISRDVRLNPTAIAHLLAFFAALDIAGCRLHHSEYSAFSAVLWSVSNIGSSAVVWYLTVRVWRSAAGWKPPLQAHFALVFLLLNTLGRLLLLLHPPQLYCSLEYFLDQWQTFVWSGLFTALFYAGLQYLFNLGMRRREAPREPKDYCPLWTALLIGTVGTFVLAIVLLVVRAMILWWPFLGPSILWMPTLWTP